MESGDWHVVFAHWASRAYALTAPQITVRGRMALFLASAILWSLVWLLYRAWQVVQTPNEVLVDKLGLDIPPAPEVTLEDISDHEVQITWKLPDVHSSIQKHVIQLNSSKVGETKRHETAVSILNLKSGAFYDLRVFTVSAAGFQTPSRLVHFRTVRCPQKQEQDGKGDLQPVIRTNIVRAPPLPSPSAPAMSREMSGGPTQARRTTIGRKHSPANIGHDVPAVQVDDASAMGDDGDDSLVQLSERFQKIQQDNEAAEGQLADEDKEFEASLKELEVKRDELKHSLKERDEASNDLRKQVHKMESANRSAQSEKSKKEKLLQQKEAQRKKRREDITRWKEQTEGIEEELARIEAEKDTVEANKKQRIDELRQKIEGQQREVKGLDEVIKEKGTQVKELEEERKHLHAEEENDESREADRLELEKERLWQEKLHNLNATYMSLCNALGLAKSQFEAARDRLAWCENARRNNPAFAPVAPLDLDLSRKPTKQRRTRASGSLTSNVSSPNGPFSAIDSAFGGMGFSQAPINPSPTFASGPTFFNMSNGTALGGIPEPGVPTAEEIDVLTGGAPMSPRADALLPANLLGDEESLAGADDEGSTPDSLSADIKQLPTLGPSALKEDEQTPRSPSSSTSSGPSASMFQSPRESMQNISDLRDYERSSIRSSQQSPVQLSLPEKSQSTSQRFTGLFSFNRQKNKDSSDEPPALGTLKPGQSQSFPRNYEDVLDPVTQRRRRLSQGNWANGMSNLFPRTFSSEDKEGLTRAASSRRMLPSIFSSSSRLNPANFGKPSTVGYDPFGAKPDSTDASYFGASRNGSSSPRPSSVYSFDRLPRPSTETQPFGWGQPDKANVRGSPLGPDWSTAWSRSQSRRPSIQFGSTSNLSLGGPHEDIEYVDPPREPQRPLQAPIGTRPPSSQRPITPKLNPAAPSFRTLFTKRPDKEKDKDKAKAKESDGSFDRPPTQDSSIDDVSPPMSRKSRDGRSIATSNSMASMSMTDSRESLDRISSSVISEGPTPSAARESFIQKITRKSSSTKFNSWKDKSGSLFLSSRSKGGSVGPGGEPSTPSTNDFDESFESTAHSSTPGGEHLGRSVESGSSLTPSHNHDEKAKEWSGSVNGKDKRSSISWNFMRKKDKKTEHRGTNPNELDETGETTSAASETGEESVHEAGTEDDE